MKKIYLDYNATTPIHPLVAREMEKYIKKYFGNPSSNHWFGIKAKDGVEKARKQVASLVGCKPEEIIFTSGGSESNNSVIRGVAEAFRDKGSHIITTQIEHPSVLEPCRYLKKKGFAITYLPVDKYGMVNPGDVKKAIRPSTILITIMHANNEVGTVQPITEISKIAKEKGILFHSDAAQSVGKILTKVNNLGVDFLTLAGHKLYAAKGIGGLYIRKGIDIQPFILGAGNENGRRAGTENVIGIVGLGRACQILEKDTEKNTERIRSLRDKLFNGLVDAGIKLQLNGHPECRLPNTLNISFIGVTSRELMKIIPNIAVSTGAACHSHSGEPSRVLLAMGIQREDAFGAIRFSLGLWTKEEEIGFVVAKIREVL